MKKLSGLKNCSVQKRVTSPKALELCTTQPHTKRTHGGVPVSTGFIKVEVSTSRVRWPGKKAVKISANTFAIANENDFAEAAVMAA
jgi:hypothetical protein